MSIRETLGIVCALRDVAGLGNASTLGTIPRYYFDFKQEVSNLLSINYFFEFGLFYAYFPMLIFLF